jgi:hypothetical protein
VRDAIDKVMSVFWENIDPLINELPLPHEYARLSVWPHYQYLSNQRILCCRPGEATGLPLSMLLDIFRQFHIDISDRSSVSVEALQLARDLSMTMPRSFNWDPTHFAEDMRTAEFDKCAESFLGKFDREHKQQMFTEQTSNRVDGTLHEQGIPIAIREMKAEPGASGDAWFQLARMYDITIKALMAKSDQKVQNFLRRGAPMFLFSVVGECAFLRLLLHRCSEIYFRTISFHLWWLSR